MLDYPAGLLLIASPWLFGFNDDTTASRIPMAIGIVMLLQSLMTDYEMGALRKISMRSHLTLDALAGLFLMASPWLFGFADEVFVPHVFLGALELGSALMTRTAPTSDRPVASRAKAAVTR
jgi:hypothetical protein